MSVVYGEWAAQNPSCVTLSNIDLGVRTFELCWGIMCACQAVFFALRYPRGTWEFVLVPLTECFVYGLGYSEIGYILLWDGRQVLWTRTVLWLATVPIILNQINGMAAVRIYGVDLNVMQMYFSTLMICFGHTAALTHNQSLKWLFFIIAMAIFGLICFINYHTFTAAEKHYKESGSEIDLIIAKRIRLLAVIFFTSWTMYPLFFVLSVEGACVASESVILVCFALADLLSKNVFGVLFWDTLWNLQDGKWSSYGTVTFFKTTDSVTKTAISTAMEEEFAKQKASRSDNPPAQYPFALPDAENSIEQELSQLKQMNHTMMATRQFSSLDHLNDFEHSDQRYAPGVNAMPNGSPGSAGSQGVENPVQLSAITKTGAIHSMDDVVDHVRSLNQALSDLLVTDDQPIRPPR